MENCVHLHVLTFNRHNDERYLSFDNVAYPENLRAADLEALGFR
jgi:hypothetical protein